MPYTSTTIDYESKQGQPGLDRRTVSAALLGSILTAACGGGSTTTAGLQIIEHPADVKAERGATATFSVVINDPTGAKYQWKKDGIELPGENRPTLTLTDVHENQNGATFNVEISSPHGETSSRPARLLVVTTYGIVPSPLLNTSTIIGTDRSRNFFAVRRTEDKDVVYKVRPNGEKLNIAKNLVELTVPSIETKMNGFRVWATEAPNGEIYFSQVATIFSMNNERAIGGRILKISPDGGVTTLFESREICPAGIVFNPSGEAFTIDFVHNSLYKIDASGSLTKVVDLGLASSPNWIPTREVWLACTKDGLIFAGISSAQANNLVMVTTDNQVRSVKMGRRVVGLGAYKSSAYVLEEEENDTNKVIRKINPDGTSSIVAGTLAATGESLVGSLPGRLRNVSWCTQAPDGKIYLYGDPQSLVITTV
ncbi:hypothetical protein ACINB_21420 [Acidovorax sp. NB1]|nr:hypothetical protein ACINB_21420 [Acidovorax sp. NB1]